MTAPARRAAYEALRLVSDGRADLPHALARVRPALEDERDRALTGEIAAGTLRWRAALDHVIAQAARRPLARLDAEVLEILRLSVYQLLHLDRIPASAVVHDAVDLTRDAGKRSAAGFVNGVLRAIDRDRQRLPLPPPPDEAARAAMARDAAARAAALDFLAITLSHPRWLVGRWLDRYGFAAAAAWARFNNSPAALTVRANRLKTSRDDLAGRLREHGVEATPARFAPDALVVTSGNPLSTPLAGSGLFFVQDEASQIVALLVDPGAGQRVLDACASPGGKTTAMAALMGDRGLLVAADVRSARVRLLTETISRSGARSVRVVQADLARRLPFGAAFDAVLVDAPCSGLGTLRRDPDIRWRRREEDLPRFAEAQRAMLAEAATAVRPGGRLVYATCSSEPEENEEVVAAFLARHPAFAPLDARRAAPDPALAPLVDDAGHLHTLPDAHGLEAFFGAVMVRRPTL